MTELLIEPARDIGCPALNELSEVINAATASQRSPVDDILDAEIVDEEPYMRHLADGLGLQWLATHQSTDGRWSLDAFHQRHQCGQQCTHQGSVHSDTGATALALLPFLARGETHRSGSYKKVVSAGLRWLVADQDGNGAFHSIADGKMYSHGLATIALCEAWALTEDRQLRGPAQRAIDYVIAAQSGSGGWRYFPRVDADTSVLGWQMIALVSARAGGLLLNPNPMAGASRYLDSAQVDKAGSQYSYTPRGGASLAMTAKGLLC